MCLEEAKRLHARGEQAAFARRNRFLDWLLTWHGRVTLAHNVQRSQVHHDISREAVERILPKLLGSDVGVEYFKGGAYDDPATKLARFYYQKMGYFGLCERRARDKMIFGRGVMKWMYANDQRRRKRVLTAAEIGVFQRVGFTNFPRTVTETVTLYDGPRAYNVDPFTMTYDTSVDDPRRCYFLFEEFRSTIQQMQAEAKAGRYDADAVAEYETDTPPTQPGFVDRWRNEAIARIGIDYGTAYSLSEPTGFALEEGYFPFDIDGNGRDESILLVCDPGFRVAFRCQENPFHHGEAPYSFDDWLRVTGEFWPVGIVEILEQTQAMLNVWTNLGIDNIILTVFPLWLKHRGAQIPGNSLVLTPNRLIPTNMLQGLQQLKQEDRTQQTQTWVQFYLKRAQELSGITQFNALGTPEVGQTKTALGITALKQAAEEFLGFARKRMIEEAMHRDGELFLSLAQQYIDQPKTVAILGEDQQIEPLIVQPDDLLGDFTWQAVVEQMAPLSREIESQNFESIVEKAQKLGLQQNLPEIVIELAKRRGVPNYGRFLAKTGPGGMPSDPTDFMQNLMARQAVGNQGSPPRQPSMAGGPQPQALPAQLATQGA